MRLRNRLWNPCAVVFLSNTCIMVLELVASRLIAPRLGVSLYTWTSVIGVILAGISIGNYLGGRLADRYASPFFLGVILALASLATLSTLALANALSSVGLPQNLPLLVSVVAYIAALFLLPSLVLGCVSPIVIKLSLTDLQRSGTTVGKIYAWSSVGSIVGTFATGFWLIAWFGTRTVVLLVAAILLAMAIWFLTATRPRRAAMAALVVVLLFGGAVWLLDRGGDLQGECLRETNYYCIKVHDKDMGDGSRVRELVLDRLVHSYSDLDDPTHLVYG